MNTQALAEILKSEFERKKTRNPMYSLRSFSRDLKIDPSNLSKIMNKRKPVGRSLSLRLAQRLGMTYEELNSLCESATDVRDAQYKHHSLQAFTLVSDWYHYAILELFKVSDFEPEPRLIATRLNLPLETVRKALARLEQAHLLRRNAKK